ncbi:MAG: hypothetical protein ABIP79_13590 [Chitinophagaceae bacterium]
MKKEFDQPHIYKPLMAGLMAGIIATVLNIFYDVMYRSATGFSLSDIINVSSIIFGTVLALLIAGSIFALLERYTRYVQLVYILVFVILTLLCVRWALHVHRISDPTLNSEFRGLLTGIVIISGCLASFLVPFFVKHEKIFM